MTNENTNNTVAEGATNTNDNKTTKAARAKKKFNPTDVIPCRSITYGELILEGYKTKLLYTWANAGDVTDVEYQDLQALQSRKSRFLTEPLFVIEDEDLVAQWSSMLGSLYSKIVEDDLEDILKLAPAKLKARLSAAPEGIKSSIASMAAAKITSGELDSIARIKVIDEVLGSELLSMIS